MFRTKAELQGLVKKAITVKEVCPALSISAAMRMAKFNNEEANGLTLQQGVRRMVSLPSKNI
jgi:hypothetical protein